MHCFSQDQQSFKVDWGIFRPTMIVQEQKTISSDL